LFETIAIDTEEIDGHEFAPPFAQLATLNQPLRGALRQRPPPAAAPRREPRPGKGQGFGRATFGGDALPVNRRYGRSRIQTLKQKPRVRTCQLSSRERRSEKAAHLQDNCCDFYNGWAVLGSNQ
jgi:hypothetical protein